MWGRYMFEFSDSKDMKSMFHRKGGDNREDSNTFMSNTNCQGIENQQGGVVTTLNMVKH